MNLALGAHAQSGFFAAAGQRLEYSWLPPAHPDLPSFVLLHEGLGCVSMWRGFPLVLASATGRGVFCYSRAGYGRSQLAHLPRAVRYMHDEAQIVLPEVLAATGLARIVLLGHSDGGSISLIHGGHDSRVDAMVLMAPHVFNEQVCVDSVHTAIRDYENTDLRKRFMRHHGEQVDAAFRGWADIWIHPDFWHWNVEAYLPRVKVPVLVLQGEDDPYGTTAQVEAISRQVVVPCETCLLSACGHSPHRDQPASVLDRILRFVNGVSRADPVESL